MLINYLQLNPKGNPFSFLSQQSVINVNQWMHWLTALQLNPKGNFIFFLSQQSTSNANQWMCQLTSLQFDAKGILSPLSPNNQPLMSINECVNWLLWNLMWREILSLFLPTINKDYQSMNALINYFLTQYKEKSFCLSLPTFNQFYHCFNDCIDWLLLNFILLLLTTINKFYQSTNMLIDYFATWGLISPTSCKNPPKQIN